MSHQSNDGQVNDREDRAASLGKELAEAYRKDGIVRANGLFDAGMIGVRSLSSHVHHLVLRANETSSKLRKQIFLVRPNLR